MSDFVLGRGNDHDDGYDLVGEYVHGFQLVARGFRLVVHVHHGHDQKTAPAPANETTASTSGTTSSTIAAPKITNLTPNSCPLDAQGAEVKITGTGFTGVSAVTFGGMDAMDFHFDSDTQITAHAPVHAAGTVVSGDHPRRHEQKHRSGRLHLR